MVQASQGALQRNKNEAMVKDLQLKSAKVQTRYKRKILLKYSTVRCTL